MDGPTKEQQVRALREARYKKKGATSSLTVKKLLKMPDAQFEQMARVCPRCLLYQQEIRFLKRELAGRRKPDAK